MSSHFNYEIEERNMRNQLKELEVSYKEDAWFSYEDYAKQFQSVNKTQLLPNFNFALNRTVILPVVFGGIIILFSFLLFNFINIKNTKTKAVVSEIKPTISSVPVEPPKPQPKKQAIVPVKKEELPVVTTSSVSITTPLTNTFNTVATKIVPTTTVATNPVITNVISQDTQVAKTIPTYTFEPKRKRRKKADAEVLESIATPVSLPTVTQEEAEPELR